MLACGLGLATAGAAPAAGSAGGAYASDPASIRTITCAAGCAAMATAQAGSLLRVRGRDMGGVRQIVFLGGPGNDDNATARVIGRRATSVDVSVPERASSGRLRAVNADGLRSAASRATITIERRGSGSGPLDARVIGRRAFVDAARPARMDLLARASMSVAVTLVRVADGVAVQSWPVMTLAPGVPSSVTWRGTVAGAAQPVGRYEFRVFAAAAAGAGGAQAATAAPLATGPFDLLDHKFPVRGKHDFGGPEAAFGTQRAGHAHEGQDVMAACGTPLVAARGGVVKLNQTQSNAGNYLVIDGEGTDVDYAYMHLREPSPLKKGARVLTGQPIGDVGRTGDASACHLHFEMWSAPGWYTGGSPIDPLPYLKAWDAYS